MIYGIIFLAITLTVTFIMMRSTAKDLNEVHERTQSYLDVEPTNNNSMKPNNP